MELLEEVLQLLELFFLHLFHFRQLGLTLGHDERVLVDLTLDAYAESL